jgi:BirA family transcriptional regulator, biotin operon repressor / biotin---[acetyl-CoA-carboxylase] ligase
MTTTFSASEDAARLAVLCGNFADTEVLSTVGSTNQYLLDQKLTGLCRPKLVWTHEQPSGRGRRGRTWIGQAEHSLMFSMQFCRQARLAMPGGSSPLPLTGLPIAVGVALVETLSQYADDLQLKWPNDLQRAGRKFGGILIESRHRVMSLSDRAGLQPTQPWQLEQVIIGVGLNLFVDEVWHQSIGQPACGLFESASYPLRATIAAQLAQALNEAWLQFQIHALDAVLPRFQKWDALFGLPVRVLDAERLLFEGIANGLSHTGCLLVQTAEGQQEVSFGDVSVRSITGTQCTDQTI